MEIWKEFEHNDITHSAAHHLMAVDDLVTRLGYARVSDVARQLNITRGSVSISLKPLKEAGLLLQDDNKHLRLSEAGQHVVDAIKTKRLLIERLFHDVLGVDEHQAEVDACKLEHLVSNATASRLVSFLRFFHSDDGAAQRFVARWREFDEPCGHAPVKCPSCESQCLGSTVAGDLAESD